MRLYGLWDRKYKNIPIKAIIAKNRNVFEDYISRRISKTQEYLLNSYQDFDYFFKGHSLLCRIAKYV